LRGWRPSIRYVFMVLLQLWRTEAHNLRCGNSGYWRI